jgi:hypothetical protein
MEPLEPAATSAPWTAAPPPTHPIDTTSRVISFVLGFALASLIAWLGSIGGDEIAGTPIEEPVAAAVTPVDSATIEEKTSAITEEKDAKAADVTAPPPAPVPLALVRANPARPAQVAAAQPRAPRPAVAGYRGALALSSNPEGAQVVLNGKVVGETPVVLSDLPVGSRALVVRREGYSPWSASVRVVANQRTTVRATLTPTQQPGG